MMDSLQYRALNLPSCAATSACTSGVTLPVCFKVISGERSAAEAPRGLVARALISAGELLRFTGRTGEFSGEDTAPSVAVCPGVSHVTFSCMDVALPEYLSNTEKCLAVIGAHEEATQRWSMGAKWDGGLCYAA